MENQIVPEKQELPDNRVGLYVLTGIIAASPLIIAAELFACGVAGAAWNFCFRMWGG